MTIRKAHPVRSQFLNTLYNEELNLRAGIMKAIEERNHIQKVLLEDKHELVLARIDELKPTTSL